MIANLQPFQTTRHSTVPWLGEIPIHCNLQERTVLSLSYGQIVVKCSETLHGLVPSSFETYQIVDPSDTIVRVTDLQNDQNSLRFAICRNRGIITSAYLCLVANKRIIPEYGYLLLHSYDLKKIFYGLGSGLRQNLDRNDFRYLPCLVPPLSEQSEIVRFLDIADRRIRRYIRAKQTLIALLEEQKQAIIHQAVTGQIDVRTGQPYRVYKRTGVEWIEELPAHWRLYGRLIEGEREPRRGDLICCRNVSVGAAALVTTQDRFAMGQDVCLIRSSSENQRWLNYFLYSKVMSDQLALVLVGSTFNRINVADIKALLIAVPPVSERSRIAAFLDHELSKIDAAIRICDREQDLLREFRTRLIADVVTGKLDVRHAAAEHPDDDYKDGASESSDEHAVHQEVTV